MTPDELPPAFKALRDELREAAARDIEIEGRVAQRLRRGRWRRRLFVVVAALVSAGGVAVAQRLLDSEGPDKPGDRLPKRAAPAADPGVIATNAIPDPSGGPPWALRLFTNPDGQECVAVGRLLNGTLGVYDETRTFRKLPADVSGACGPPGGPLLVAVQRRGHPEQRTLVYGLAQEGQPVRVTIAGETRTLRPGAFGSFIDVRAGLFDMRGANVSTTAAGRTVDHPLG